MNTTTKHPLHRPPSPARRPLTSALRSLPTALRPLPSVLRPLTSVLRPLPSALRLLSSALRPLPSVLRPLTSVLCLLSSVLRPLTSALRPLPSVLCLLPSVLCLTSCSLVPEPKADPTRHYVLTAPADTRVAAREIPQGKPLVALHAIDMPAYLRARRNIAVRQGTNEIVYHEFARWAEALEDGVMRVVCDRLVATGAVSGVAILPGRAERTCDLTIRVLECEGALPADGAAPVARFSVEYEITQPGRGATITGTRTFTAPPAAWDGKDFSALAALLGQAASALADDIAKNIPAK